MSKPYKYKQQKSTHAVDKSNKRIIQTRTSSKKISTFSNDVIVNSKPTPIPIPIPIPKPTPIPIPNPNTNTNTKPTPIPLASLFNNTDERIFQNNPANGSDNITLIDDDMKYTLKMIDNPIVYELPDRQFVESGQTTNCQNKTIKDIVSHIVSNTKKFVYVKFNNDNNYIKMKIISSEPLYTNKELSMKLIEKAYKLRHN